MSFSSKLKSFLKKTDVLGIDPIVSDPLGVMDILNPDNPSIGNIPQKTFTFGGSTLTNQAVTIDPKIAALQAEGRGMAESTLSGIQGARTDVVGDRETFIERRGQGLRERIEQQKTSLGERLEKTGVVGEFGKQSQESFVASANQKIAQGEKMSMDELIGLEGNFDRVEGGAISVINSLDMNEFAQQMQAQGMSDALVKSLTQIQLGKAGTEAQKQARKQSDIGNLIMAGALFFSSRTFKNSMEPLDNQQILDSMMELDVEKWKYNGENAEHIGCYAEDFNERFGVEGDKTISVVDIIGVLMASIQAQQKQIEELRSK